MKCGPVAEINELTFILIFILPVTSIMKSFSECHDDFTLHPSDGILPPYTFSWIGVVHYKHIETGLRYAHRSPRVVLIHRQFALANSRDVSKLPYNHKLGDVIINDYEREETDCGLTFEEIRRQVRCPRASIEIPIDKVIIHPESSRFQVEHSLAILKLWVPVGSPYVLPLCLPSTEERKRQADVRQVFLVDFVSAFPRDIDTYNELKAKRTLRLLPEDKCRSNSRNTSDIFKKTSMCGESALQVLCTSGCGIRSGSPIVAHTPGGAFEIMGISIGGRLCKTKKMRKAVLLAPPLYIDIYPYRTWIVNIITANVMPSNIPAVVRNKSFKRRRTDNAGEPPPNETGWIGRWYSVGVECFKHTEKVFNKKYANYTFYHEVFTVNSVKEARVKYFLQLSAGYQTKIFCAKLKMPHRRTNIPQVDGIETFRLNISLSTKWFPEKYELVIALYGFQAFENETAKWAEENFEFTKMFWDERNKTNFTAYYIRRNITTTVLPDLGVFHLLKHGIPLKIRKSEPDETGRSKDRERSKRKLDIKDLS